MHWNSVATIFSHHWKCHGYNEGCPLCSRNGTTSLDEKCMAGIAMYWIALGVISWYGFWLVTHCGLGPHLNIKTVFPRYGDSHVKDKDGLATLLSCSAPSHYLNQCRLTAIYTLINKLRINFNPNAKIVFQGNAFENIVCKMSAILFQSQYVSHPDYIWLVASKSVYDASLSKQTWHLLILCIKSLLIDDPEL